MSREDVDRALTKIAEIDKSGYQLNSVLAISKNLSYNEMPGPLAGIPILIKDNIEAIGLPATAGSLALSNTPVVRDSTIATRLRAAGATIIGATNLSEWANIRSSDVCNDRHRSEMSLLYLPNIQRYLGKQLPGIQCAGLRS